MKTLHKLLILVAGISIILTTGCKKEIKNTVNHSQQISTDMNAKILRMIATFKSKMNSSFKDEEEITKDSAVWYIEATINETYARTDVRMEKLLKDSCLLSIPLTGHQTVLVSSADTAYSQFIRNLRNYYDTISGDKSLYLVDIRTTKCTNDSLTVCMEYYIMTGPGPNPRYDWSFGVVDYWYWGYGAGKCGPYSGDQPKDATTQLTTHAIGRLYLTSNEFFVNIWTTPVIYPWDVSIAPYYPPTLCSTTYSGKRLFDHGHFEGPEADDCLCPEAMNYYLDQLDTIASLYHPNGKFTCSYFVSWTILMPPPTAWEHLHYATISYGVPVVADGPPADL